MSVHKIPPNDKRKLTLGAISDEVKSALSPFIKGRKGRQHDTNLENAMGAIMEILESKLKLPDKPSKGATVMTEGASMRNPHTHGYTIRPEDL